MKIHFIGGIVREVEVFKETKKYLEVRVLGGFSTRYRVNKENGEVQDWTYHNVIKGLYVTND